MSAIEQSYDLSVVLLKRNGEADTHPSGARILQENNHLAVLGNPQKINRLVHDNQ